MSEDMFPIYTLGERRMDHLVHMVALAWAVVAIPLLFIGVAPWGDAAMLVACLLYSLGLLWMLGFSAAYNRVQAPRVKSILRRLDHAGIFVMIAGSYAPFALVKLSSTLGNGILVFIWALALVGIYMSLRLPGRADKAMIFLCLTMGWSVVVIMPSLVAAVSSSVLVLLVIGGVLYTSGVMFHLAKRLRYHNAIWHVFVLAAVVCHYIAIFLALKAA
ncbi:MAG: hemolysin III family protein [Kiloniellales bacterium]